MRIKHTLIATAAAVLTMTGSAQALATDPDLVGEQDFGAVQIGTSVSHDFVWKNTTGTTVQVRFDLTFAGGAWAVRDLDCDEGVANGSVRPGGECRLRLVFTPPIVSTWTPDFIATVQTVTAPQSTIRYDFVEPTGRGVVFAPPDSLTFGDVAVGAIGASRPIVLHANIRAAITSIDLDDDAGDFVVQRGDCVGRILLGDCTVSVRFAPTGPGRRSARLTLTTRDESHVIALAGDGVAAPEPVAVRQPEPRIVERRVEVPVERRVEVPVERPASTPATTANPKPRKKARRKAAKKRRATKRASARSRATRRGARAR